MIGINSEWRQVGTSPKPACMSRYSIVQSSDSCSTQDLLIKTLPRSGKEDAIVQIN
jgi:hypothetical protein